MDFKFAFLEDGEFADSFAAADHNFEIGDIVRLITGSPEMVIISIGDHDIAEVCWYDDFGGLNIEALPLEALCDALGNDDSTGDDGRSN